MIQAVKKLKRMKDRIKTLMVILKKNKRCHLLIKDINFIEEDEELEEEAEDGE